MFRLGHQTLCSITWCDRVLRKFSTYEGVAAIVFTCIRSWLVELRVGVPWSAAVTVKAYSARSAALRGEAVLSSPVVGLMEKRSALEPEGNEANIISVWLREC